MPDCNHSTASCSCSCVALLAGGEIRGGASCARGQQLLGGDMLMVGCVTYKHCHQHLYLTHSHYLHIQLGLRPLLETLDKEEKWSSSVPCAPTP